MSTFLLLTLALTYPLVLHFTDAVPGPPSDNWQFYWDLWWVKRAVTGGANPYFTTDVFYPHGSFLYFTTLHLVPSLLAAPVAAVCGLTVGYNFMVVLAFVLGGYGAYRLALDTIAPEDHAPHPPAVLAAVLGGCVFTFSAYHLQYLLGALNLVSLQWMPFYALYLLRAWRRESRWNPVAGAVFFVLASLTDWHYTLWLLLFTGLFVVVHAVTERHRPGSRRSLARVGALLALGLLALAPVLVPALRLGRSAGRSADPYREAVALSAGLVDFVVPGLLHPIWHWLPRPDAARVVAFLGFVPLALVLWAARRLWTRQRFFVIAAAFFGVLALGPELHVGREVVTVFGHAVPMPYALLHRVPYVEISRSPGRMVVLCHLALAVLAAQSAWWLLGGLASPARRRLVGALLVLGIALETASIPFEMSFVSIPPAYAWLAGDPRRVALLEIPLAERGYEDAPRMLYQTRHGKPIYGGYLSRGSPSLPFEALPGFAQLELLASEPPPDLIAYDLATLPLLSRTVLALHGAGYVVLDKDRLLGDRLRRARLAAGAVFERDVPAYEDGRTMVYAVPPPGPAPAFLYLGEGWSYVEHAAEAGGQPSTWRWMSREARFGMFAPGPGRWQLRLRGWSLGRPRRMRVSVDGRDLGTLLLTPEANVYRSAPIDLTAGVHSFDLRCLDGPEAVRPGPDPRPISIAVSEAGLEERSP